MSTRAKYGTAKYDARFVKAYALGAGKDDVDRVRTIASEYARGDIAWRDVVAAHATF